MCKTWNITWIYMPMWYCQNAKCQVQRLCLTCDELKFIFFQDLNMRLNSDNNKQNGNIKYCNLECWAWKQHQVRLQSYCVKKMYVILRQIMADPVYWFFHSFRCYSVTKFRNKILSNMANPVCWFFHSFWCSSGTKFSVRWHWAVHALNIKKTGISFWNSTNNFILG